MLTALPLPPVFILQPCVLEYKSPGYEGSGGEVGRGTTDTRAAMQLSMM